MLVNGLPPDAAVFRVDGQQWTVRDELLALAIERYDHWGLVQAYLHSDKKFHRGLPDEPLRIPRPGEAKRSGGGTKDEVITDPRIIAQFFGG